MVSEWHMDFGPAWPVAHRVELVRECPHDYIVKGVKGPVCLRCGADDFPREDDPWVSYVP